MFVVTPPLEHRFTLDGDPYLLVEWNRGGERRIRADYAMAIAAAPGVIDSIDGASLYAEAVARECLREAPEIFWESRPPTPAQNGTPTRVVNVDQVPRLLWERFRQEIDAFLALLFPAAPAAPDVPPEAGPGEPLAVAAAQALPAVFRGRAE